MNASCVWPGPHVSSNLRSMRARYTAAAAARTNAETLHMRVGGSVELMRTRRRQQITCCGWLWRDSRTLMSAKTCFPGRSTLQLIRFIACRHKVTWQDKGSKPSTLGFFLMIAAVRFQQPCTFQRKINTISEEKKTLVISYSNSKLLLVLLDDCEMFEEYIVTKCAFY